MNIIIIGAGNIGRRHLEGVLTSGKARGIHVVDPAEASRGAARALIDAAATPMPATYSATLDDLPASADLIIDATCAEGRRERLQTVMARTRTPHMLIEKVVFQNVEDFDTVGAEAVTRGIDVRVNFPRRLAPVHRRLAALIADERRKDPDLPLSLGVTGGGWSLACNATHFLDLYLMLAGPGETLHDWWSDFAEGHVESKRAGAIEVFGTLAATGKRGSVALSCDKDPAPVRIDLSIGKHRIIVREMQRSAHTSGSVWQVEDAAVPFVSSSTAEIVTAVYKGTDIPVPPLATARTSHAVQLDAIRRHLEAGGVEVGPNVPIT